MQNDEIINKLSYELMILPALIKQKEMDFLDTSEIPVQNHTTPYPNGQIDNNNSITGRANVEHFRKSILFLVNNISKIKHLYPQRDGDFLYQSSQLIFSIFDEYYYTFVKKEQWTDSNESHLYRIFQNFVENLFPLMFQTIERKYTTAEHKELAFQLVSDVFQNDVIEIVNLTYKECITCYETQCYLGSISLAGRVIETVLSQLFKKLTGTDADESGMGIDAICNGLKKAGFLYIKKDVLKNQLEIVKTHRNKAVHGSIVLPTKEECKAIILFVKDLLIKLQDF